MVVPTPNDIVLSRRSTAVHHNNITKPHHKTTSACSNVISTKRNSVLTLHDTISNQSMYVWPHPCFAMTSKRVVVSGNNTVLPSYNVVPCRNNITWRVNSLVLN